MHCKGLLRQDILFYSIRNLMTLLSTVVRSNTINLQLLVWFACFSTGSNQYGSIQGHTSVTSGSLLDDDHWHSVVIMRYRRNVNFTLDHHTQQFRTNGEFDHLDLDYEVKTPHGSCCQSLSSSPTNVTILRPLFTSSVCAERTTITRRPLNNQHTLMVLTCWSLLGKQTNKPS